MQYLVRWEIDIWADTPEEAVKQARKIQLDPQSIATIFKVSGKGVPMHSIDEEDLRETQTT